METTLIEQQSVDLICERYNKICYMVKYLQVPEIRVDLDPNSDTARARTRRMLRDGVERVTNRQIVLPIRLAEPHFVDQLDQIIVHELTHALLDDMHIEGHDHRFQALRMLLLHRIGRPELICAGRLGEAAQMSWLGRGKFDDFWQLGLKIASDVRTEMSAKSCRDFVIAHPMAQGNIIKQNWWTACTDQARWADAIFQISAIPATLAAIAWVGFVWI